MFLFRLCSYIENIPKIFLILICCLFGIFGKIYSINIIHTINIIILLIFFLLYFIKKNKDKIKKTILFYLLLLTIEYSFWKKCENLILNNLKTINQIFNKKKLYGFIINKTKINEKKYNYTIFLNDKYLNSAFTIKIISYKQIPLGKNICIMNVFWLSKNLFTSEKKFIESLQVTKSIPIGISNSIYINKNRIFLLIENFFSIIEKLKDNINEKIKKNFSEKYEAIYNCIFMGKTDSTNEYYSSDFRNWGISHYLARSGLHTNIIVNLIVMFSLLIFDSSIISFIFSSILLFFFTLISFSSIPFYRSIITFYIFVFCKILKINTSLLKIFSCCTILFIFYNPFYIFELGFQLSFFTTGILASINFFKF
jgi:hypothetical protein